jgi:glycosyltransferase involved in cell wall biosynthesis
MRILHLDAGNQMRGGQWQVLRLLEGLREAGHENVLLSRTGSPLFEKARARLLDARPLSFGSIVKCAWDADVVHAHDAHSHTLGALAAVRRLVVSRRVAFPIGRNPLSRWKYGRAAHYIAVSHFVKNELINAGIEPGRITVVYDGVPLPPSQSPQRGSEIVAPKTEDPKKGTALIHQAGRLAHVDLTFSENLEQDVGRAAMFVYITHSEGLGSAVLMAMAAGVPVIASNAGGLPEIVEHGRTGLLAENTPEAIAQAILRLKQDPSWARSLAQNARYQVEQKFSAAKMVAGTFAVYRTL